jgi:hypothetical protein
VPPNAKDQAVAPARRDLRRVSTLAIGLALLTVKKLCATPRSGAAVKSGTNARQVALAVGLTHPSWG